MAKYPYRSLGSLLDRIFRNNLNDNFSDIQSDFEDHKSRIDNIVASTGNSNTEIVDARGTFGVLKDRLDNSDASLAEKATKGQITSTDLSISSNSDKIKLINLADEVKQSMAGNTPINATVDNDGVNYDKIAPRSISYIKHTRNIPLVFKTKPRNLFDKNAITSGYYVDHNTGNLTANSSYTASDFIPVTGGLNYSVTIIDQGAWYDVNKAFISGIAAGSTNPASAPSNAKYLRISTTTVNLSKQMVEQADTVGTYEPYFTDLKINATDYLNDGSITETLFSSDTQKKLNKTKTPKEIALELLNNPTIKTKIKLLGDSITSGVGGTGYTEDGNTIPGTTVKMNPNGHCWANELNSLINFKYNKKFTLDAKNEYIVYPSYSPTFNLQTSGDTLQKVGINAQIPNSTPNRVAASLNFYGDNVDVVYTAYGNGGIVAVYIDGVSKGNIDSYSSSGFTYGNIFSLTGLGVSGHTIELRETNTKNASSGGYIFFFEAFKVTKYSSVVNYAQAGKNSYDISMQRDTLIESDDDLVLIELGTNDRHRMTDTSKLKVYQRTLIEKCNSIGAKFVLMSAIPATVSGDNDSIRYFGMYDVDQAIRELANEHGIYHISNYDAFLKYAEYRNIDMDTLLSDGLHPNDAGYDVMFRNIVRELGLSYVRDGITK